MDNKENIPLKGFEVKNSISSIDFKFSPLITDIDLDAEKDNIKNDMDVDFNTNFSLREWFINYLSSISVNIKSKILKLPSVLSIYFKNTIAILKTFCKKPNFSLSFKFIYNFKNRLYRKNTKKIIKVYSYKLSHTALPRKRNITLLFKKSAFNLLYFLFFPLRMMIKYKNALLALFLMLYLSASFTRPGQLFTYKYFGFNLKSIQLEAYKTVDQIFKNTLDEIKYLFSTAKID